MTGDGKQDNRDWAKDNNSEGAFEEELDEFFSRKEVLAALEAANSNKLGAPFKVPDIVIEWGMKQVSGRNMGYRTVAKKIERKMKKRGLKWIRYSQFYKRCQELKVHDGTTVVTDARIMAYGTGQVPLGDDITVIFDASGLSPDRPSGWRVFYWDESSVRGWYKIHAAVDAEKHWVLAYVITEPYVNDAAVFDLLMDLVLSAGHKVAKVLADAAYDSKDNWNRMESLGIEFIANIRGSLDDRKRNSSSGRCKGCRSRAKHVKRIREVGREQWKKEVGYGQRWNVESTFADLKRILGDTIRARARDCVAGMIGWMVRVFNIYKVVRDSL